MGNLHRFVGPNTYIIRPLATPMSLVDKIPPLVSALAFGYGVGMAAPDGALHQVRGAFVSQVTPAGAAHGKKAAIEPVSPALEKKLAGRESDTLAELRASHVASRYGDSCQLRDPSQQLSRMQSQSTRSLGDDDTMEDGDEFDASETAAISRLQLPDLGLGVSRQTLKYVRFFTKTDRGRDLFETWLKRSGRYQEMIQEELRARNMPEDLIWVAMIESGFDPAAKSPAGAVGLWQFMPQTGAVYGLRQNKFVDQRKNPRLATQAAVHHLRDLYMRFGQWDLALAAYNMGYEQLLDRIDQAGTTDFNELARQGALPTETARYVPKIVAAAIVANNLERFNFDDVEPSRPVDGGEIAVAPRTSLETIAHAAGVSTSIIRKLNPDILGKELPPGKGDFLVVVPADALSRTAAALPSMMRMARESGGVDDVLDPLDLMNPDGFHPVAADDDHNLLALLPKPKKKHHSYRDPALDDLTPDDAGHDRDRDTVASDDEPRPRKGRETVIYRVGSGDTLIGVAKQFAMDVDDVARDNGLKPDAELREGGLLKLKVKRDLIDGDLPKGEAKRDREPAKRATSKG
jgi:membrane-bound lytic murein transglycosylase D